MEVVGEYMFNTYFTYLYAPVMPLSKILGRHNTITLANPISEILKLCKKFLGREEWYQVSIEVIEGAEKEMYMYHRVQQRYS